MTKKELIEMLEDVPYYYDITVKSPNSDLIIRGIEEVDSKEGICVLYATW